MRCRLISGLWPLLALVLLCATFGPGTLPAQVDNTFCGITPQSARLIAAEVMRQAGHPFDSTSPAYYVSVLASRLSPYYVVFFIQGGMVVGEMEVDICGRQGTPHPGLQYVPDSDLRFEELILEPDRAFAILRQRTGAEPAFASRLFPFGLTKDPEVLAGIDFWWMILDTRGKWHYMDRVGRPVGPSASEGSAKPSGQPRGTP